MGNFFEETLFFTVLFGNTSDWDITCFTFSQNQS